VPANAQGYQGVSEGAWVSDTEIEVYDEEEDIEIGMYDKEMDEDDDEEEEEEEATVEVEANNKEAF
jgi:hypothetical protein